MTTPISRAAVLEILRTPAASDTFPDMIRRVEALEPVAQPETPTPGQFTTMCLAIEDVVTGRGFDVAIPEEVKAYMRNALMGGFEPAT